MINRKRNELKLAYHTQSNIGWENFVKDRIAEESGSDVLKLATHIANARHVTGHQNWVALCGNIICKRCGNLEMVCTACMVCIYVSIDVLSWLEMNLFIHLPHSFFICLLDSFLYCLSQVDYCTVALFLGSTPVFLGGQIESCGVL